MNRNDWSTADFLIIGYLVSKSKIQFDNTNSELFGGLSYLEVTPASSKFCYDNKKVLYDKKIRVYVGTLLHDLRLENPNLNLRDNIDDDISTRRNKIWNFFKNYLFIIQPSYKIVHPIADKSVLYISGFNGRVHIIHQIGNELPSVDLSPVPIFSSHNTFHSLTKKEFEKSLKKAAFLGYIHAPWPVDSDDYPDGVIWKDDNGTCTLYTNINRQKIYVYNKSRKYNDYIEEVAYGFADDELKRVEKVHYDKHWLDNQYSYTNIAFIDSNLLTLANNDINNITNFNIQHEANISQPFRNSTQNGYSPYIDDNYQQINNKVNTSSDLSNHLMSNAVSNTNDEEINTIKSQKNINNDIGNTKELKINKKQGEIDMNQENNITTDSNNKNVAFIHKLMVAAITQDNPEYFKEEDLINFHTAMMSPGLVVLAGLSGTGKSSLINLYAEILGIPKDQRKFIPVRPFWNDDSDLLGYVDTVHSIYQPADCGLVDTLVKAQNDPNNLYLITFDEMNLARVEYYFSQFLSVLERDENKRYIYLYDKNLTNRLYNSNDYPYRIHIGKNVLFCGTINMDESTHKFTDKVLDRSNIINLHLVNFNSDNIVKTHTKNVSGDIDDIPELITTKYFDEMKGCRKLDDDTRREIKSLLWSLHQLLNHANSNLGIGRRIVHQIFIYLENVPKMPDGDTYHLSLKTAFDLQLAQRVFTKLRGSKQDIGKLIDFDDENHLKPNKGTLWAQLANSSLSDFKYSKHILKRKGGELYNYGFTL